jgi:predicted NAD/FAD-dependent oxidoreductase
LPIVAAHPQPPPRIAIVGAGLAGLACARTLAERGLRAQLVDKGRGPGGRTSSRRVDDLRFDHGAPKLDLAGPQLAHHVATWEHAGVLVRADRSWLAQPNGTALAAHLARGLALECAAEVTALTRDAAGWHLSLTDATTRGPFDLVILTAPAPQTSALLKTAHDPPPWRHLLDQVTYDPCLAALITLAGPAPRADLPASGALAGAWQMSARPGRPPDPRAWVAHATAAWSTAHLDDDPAASARYLAAELATALGDLPIADVIGHRWRYARVTRPLTAPFLLDRDHGLAYASDACTASPPAPSAARALLSGIALADQLTMSS